MLHIFWRTVRDRRWSFIPFAVSGIVFLWMYVTLFPTVLEASTEASNLVKSLPEELTKAFALDPRSFTTFEGFAAGKHFSLVWPILAIMIVASAASYVIAGKIDNGTIDLDLALPISRIKIYLSKMFAGVWGLFWFVVFSVLSIVPLAKIYDTPYVSRNFITMALVGFLFGLAVLGMSMFASSIFSEKGKVQFIVISLLLTMYVLNIVALLEDKLENLKYASLFYYFDYSAILLDNRVANSTWWVFLGTFVVFGTAGMYWFNRRDISI